MVELQVVSRPAFDTFALISLPNSDLDIVWNVPTDFSIPRNQLPFMNAHQGQEYLAYNVRFLNDVETDSLPLERCW
jgi:hypothetical protein